MCKWNSSWISSPVPRVWQMISLWKWYLLCFSYILNCFIVLNMKSKVFPHEGTLGSQKIWVLFKCKKLPDSLKQRNFWQSCPIFKKYFTTTFSLILWGEKEMIKNCFSCILSPIKSKGKKMLMAPSYSNHLL